MSNDFPIDTKNHQLWPAASLRRFSTMPLMTSCWKGNAQRWSELVLKRDSLRGLPCRWGPRHAVGP